MGLDELEESLDDEMEYAELRESLDDKMGHNRHRKSGW